MSDFEWSWLIILSLVEVLLLKLWWQSSGRYYGSSIAKYMKSWGRIGG